MSTFLPADAAPAWQIALWVLLGPPVGAFLFRQMSRAWAKAVFGAIGADVSEKTKARQAFEFKWILIAMYAMTLGISVWVLFLR